MDSGDYGDGPWGEQAPLVEPAQLESWVIAEDDDFLVVNKPGWLVCHPSKRGPWSSLVGAVRERLGGATVHLVSRLDRETSGVVLFALHREAARVAQGAFERRWVDKVYLAILTGELRERVEVSRALEPDGASMVAVKQRVSTCRGGHKAVTTFEPLRVAKGYTLARVLPHTGRKHQIRAHAQFLGLPVVGDKLYGPDETCYLEFVRAGWTEGLSHRLPHFRQALHASSVSFDWHGEIRRFAAPLAGDLRRLAERLLGEDPGPYPGPPCKPEHD